MYYKIILISFWLLYSLSFSICPLLASDDTVIKENQCSSLYEWVLFGDTGNQVISGELLRQTDLLTAFYTHIQCTAAWYDPINEFARADTLIALLSKSKSKEAYHYEKIATLYARAKKSAKAGSFDFCRIYSLDILLSDAAFHYAYNLSKYHRKRNNNIEQSIHLLSHILPEALSNNKLKLFYQQLKKQGWHPKIRQFIAYDQLKVSSPLGLAPLFSFSDSTSLVGTSSLAASDSVLHHYITKLQEGSTDLILHQQILSPDLVISFYSGTQFRPAWHHGINLHASAFQFIKLLEQAHLNALNSENYHLSALRELLKEFHHSQTLARNPNFLVALDLLLTDAALHYADHLNSGTINPKTLVKPWEVEKEPLNLIAFSKSLSDNTLGNFYDTLQPNHPAYKRLHRLMLLHLSLQQSYVLPFKDFQKTLIKAGNAHDCIPLIRQCFSLLDNANFDTTSNKLYDKVLENRIKRFQKAHKTTPNGNISSNTLGHLTEAMQQRFEKLLINLERWRWLPNNFGNEYVWVNIPTYHLQVIKYNRKIIDKRIMIGTTETPTPPLVDLMTYIDFNPYWTLPPSIAKQEYLPKLQKNAEILDKYNMKLYYGKKEINPKKINWKKVKEDKFVYTIRQLSGKTNSLGRVKFVFPNNLHIYLHDTHARHLFKKKTRAYSHGCIRVQAPLDLAEELLSTIKKWDRKRINNVIKSEKHERIILEHQIPVYLIYLTLYVSPDGELHEYDDIYDRENELIGRLRKQLKT